MAVGPVIPESARIGRDLQRTFSARKSLRCHYLNEYCPLVQCTRKVVPEKMAAFRAGDRTLEWPDRRLEPPTKQLGRGPPETSAVRLLHRKPRGRSRERPCLVPRQISACRTGN
jgi:hypothetical protein